MHHHQSVYPCGMPFVIYPRHGAVLVSSSGISHVCRSPVSRVLRSSFFVVDSSKAFNYVSTRPSTNNDQASQIDVLCTLFFVKRLRPIVTIAIIDFFFTKQSVRDGSCPRGPARRYGRILETVPGELRPTGGEDGLHSQVGLSVRPPRSPYYFAHM